MTYEDITVPDRQYLSDLAKQLGEPGTFGHLVLWIKLSCGLIPGFKFVHDHPIAGYTLDFYCPAIKLGIDVEVAGKDSRRQSDKTRHEVLEANGIMLVSFTDEEILQYTDDVVEHIRILATAFDRIERVRRAS